MAHGEFLEDQWLVHDPSPRVEFAFKPLSTTRGSHALGGLCSSESAMRFAVLGPLEVRADDGPVSVGGPQQRALLVALLVHANEPVSAEQLAIALWGEDAAQ